MTKPTLQVTELGQSLWYDNIQRALLVKNSDGSPTGLEKMVQAGDIRGVTSNPSIFHNAISKSSDYDSALVPMALAGESAEDIFWALAVDDIQQACDQLLPLYTESNSADGYVSLEVSPNLAHDTDGTVAQAKQLWARVNRPNLMIKIPATSAGIPAVRQAIAAGLNVNVTLIFSIERYREVMEAYISGLEDRVLAGGDLEKVHSVASFFVSRVDSKIDPLLAAQPHLAGKAAIANAKLAYAAFRQEFGAPRFGKLQLVKANFQRPLWASTGTKNPAYPDTLYIDELIGPATVNTVPPATLDAFRDHGKAAATLMQGVDECEALFGTLAGLGIDIARVTQELEDEGVKAFVDAFGALLASIEERKRRIVSEFGALANPIGAALRQHTNANLVQRVWAHDPAAWTNDPVGQAEIKIRLDWLDLPETSQKHIEEINQFVMASRAEGVSHFLLFGMGGSSLAPEVLSLCFATEPGITFAILDSTDPGQVIETEARFPLEKTNFIVASKSGGTAEIVAMFNAFWKKAEARYGAQAGSRFIAITDPGTGLEELAKQRGFKKIFLSNPNVGGRYSVLTPFGLVPAGLMGLEVARFLRAGAIVAGQCKPTVPALQNPGLVLGVAIGEAAKQGVDKLTILADAPYTSVGSWLEQLVAESTGKLGVGVVPVDLEPLDEKASFNPDRFYVYLRANGAQDGLVAKLRAAGIAVLLFEISDPYQLAGEFYRWEFATAIACAVLGVNAFDQPDVQDAKTRTNNKIAEYNSAGRLPEGNSVAYPNGIRVFRDGEGRLASPAEEIWAFLASAKDGDYIAINAYLPRNDQAGAKLARLRGKILAKKGVATTLGFGPRFQHSTGQLHKGGANNGLFLQITCDPAQDMDIPEKGLTFGTLERAQALGDKEALDSRKKRVLRVHLGSLDALDGLVDSL